MTTPNNHDMTTADAWSALRAATPARIALGRAGASLPTQHWLDFQAAHAAARGAVHAAFDAELLAAEIRKLGINAATAHSAAENRQQYLLRPDLGRQLSDRSRFELEQWRSPTDCDLSIIVSDGLSAIAAHRQAPPLLAALLPKLQTIGWRLAPLVVARSGRVALQDEIGELFGATIALILLGERPGLGSPDSLGAYLIYSPQIGNTDANRNCVSNIRPEGLAIAPAAETIYYLLTQARQRQLSGTALKDDRPTLNSQITSQQITPTQGQQKT
jgi:ethanolamine ammonia-lyase small subunit